MVSGTKMVALRGGPGKAFPLLTPISCMPFSAHENLLRFSMCKRAFYACFRGPGR